MIFLSLLILSAVFGVLLLIWWALRVKFALALELNRTEKMRIEKDENTQLALLQTLKLATSFAGARTSSEAVTFSGIAEELQPNVYDPLGDAIEADWTNGQAVIDGDEDMTDIQNQDGTFLMER